MGKTILYFYLFFSHCVFANEVQKKNEWQLKPLSLNQVDAQHFLFDAMGTFQSGNLKPSTSLEGDKVENFAADVAAEYGFNQIFALRSGIGYGSGKQKNSQASTKIDGLKDLSVTLKMNFTGVINVFTETGIEYSLETLKVNLTDRTLNAVSGGGKVLVKGGITAPLGSTSAWGGFARYLYFFQREAELKGNTGSETLKISGGNKLDLTGFFEMGQSLRSGVELNWLMQESSQLASSSLTTASDFEKAFQMISVAGYLKVPLNEQILTYIKGSYALNVNKKRGADSYDQDDLAVVTAGLQAQF